MSSFLRSFAAELLPEWLKARREGREATPVEPAPQGRPETKQPEAEKPRAPRDRPV